MINISWHQLEDNSKSKELSFESFCLQIAQRKYSHLGSFEICYNTAGSEFYLELTKDCKELNASAGDIIGWQAKFWRNGSDEENSPLKSTNREALKEGLKKSIEDKPKLKCWIICTPGKFLNNKPSYPWNSLLDLLHDVKHDIQIKHWHKDEFEAIFHSDPNNYSSVFNHYFNAKFLGKELINDVTQANLKLLERKFDVDIHVKDDGEQNLLSSIAYEDGLKEINKFTKLLGDLVDELNKDPLVKKNDFKSLNEEFTQMAYSYYVKNVGVVNEVLNSYNNSISSIEYAIKIKDIIDSFEKDTEHYRDELNKHLKIIFDESKPKEVDHIESDWVDFMISSVNDISDLLFGRKKDNSLFKTINRILSKEMHVFGAAGYGKTHFACSLGYKMLEKDRPILLLLGSSFKNSDTPQERILQLLGLNGSFDFKSFLGALDNLGSINDCKIPIIIDGLNESYPSAGEVWNREIYSIINLIDEFSNIILITTCREKSEYVEQIFDKESYKDINNHIYLKGFTDENLQSAINKYFEKYNIIPSSEIYDISLFKNPLRLKIFSEVNANNNNLDINLHSIVHSIKSYMDELTKSISRSNGCVNRVKNIKLKKGLTNLGKLLWESNSRDVLFFDQFYPLFDDDLVFKLIDEGLCFQRDLKQDDELVQFTYDLVGGYQIASAVFFNSNPSSTTLATLKSEEVKEKLFSKDLSNRHPLYEDIIKAISYLLPINTGMQIYEVYNNEEIIVECFGNLELVAFNENEKEKFTSFILNRELDKETVKRLLRRLYDDVVERNNFYTLDIGLKIFVSLSQFEIDAIWNETVRKDFNKLQTLLNSILKNPNKYEGNIDNVLLFISLLTGTTDRMLRNQATRGVMKLGLRYPDNLLNLAREFVLLKDSFILESIFCSLSGVCLRIGNRVFTEKLVRFIEKDFLLNYSKNHIAILDCINTIYDYAEMKLDLKINRKLLLKNQHEKWDWNDKELNEIEDSGLWHHEMMDYDFIKYQMASLSSETYDSISKYSKAEIVALVSNRIKQNGYSSGKYKSLEDDVKKDNKYRREESFERITQYDQKQLYVAHLELAGYLLANKQIKPEIENTMRYSYVFYDPSFPEIKTKTQLVNECYLPSYNEDIQNWINDNSSELLNGIYVQTPIFHDSEMVLLHATLTQKDENNSTRIVFNINSYFLPNRNAALSINEFKRLGIQNYEQELRDTFANEISWNDYFKNDSQINDPYYSQIDCIPSVSRYIRNSQDQYQNPIFHFLNPLISREIKANFDVDLLGFKGPDGKEVTKMYKTDNSEFIFIDRDVLNKYLKDSSSDLMWFKQIRKFGEYGVYGENKLDPSFTDTEVIDIYSEFNSKVCKI